jgi:predicted secreted Zn-dependent protease
MTRKWLVKNLQLFCVRKVVKRSDQEVALMLERLMSKMRRESRSGIMSQETPKSNLETDLNSLDPTLT